MDTTENIDTTTITKRRELPPLNVYVRIRPFIADEIERGENQKLLSIIDDKHINVKVCPTTNNTIRNIQASYNEYEVTRIFDHHCNQQDLFEQILEQPTNEVFSGANWLLCTLGLTNSGKTHTMFGTPQEPGLIPKCLHRIFLNVGQNIDNKVFFKPDGLENLIPTNGSTLDIEITARNYIFKDDKNDRRRIRLPNIVQQQNSFQDLSVEDEHYSVWISFFELYNENILDLLVQPKEMKNRKNLRLIQNDESTIIRNLIQIPVFDITEAEDIIKFGFANRSTSKTNLNEASSRSHAVLCITLITINEFDEEPTMSHMYICDLAGNEPSMGTGKQLAETCNINKSLMTFKDCIRVLNENQTAKKQMLVPYRNSVLTSIFRPFFVGRGRTIICCNINPCATFVNQTNDLLKFCALAQKTIIIANEPKPGAGGLIRQQRKSKIKGPKRLIKDGPLKDKHKKDIVIDEEEIEEVDTELLDGSSFSIPTNMKSISYWKYCTKKSLDLLQKQASNRRKFLLALHNERAQTVQYLLHQREKLDSMINEKQTLSEEYESLLGNYRSEQDGHLRTQQLYNDLVLNEKQYRSKVLKLEKELKEKNLHSNDEIDSLKLQLKNLQKQYDQLTIEHTKIKNKFNEKQDQINENEQHLQDEIQRLRRDLGLELYRKQDAEKKARSLEDKLRHEQTQLQKIQYDYTQTKHEFKTLQVKYDALQLELIEMHKNGRILQPNLSTTSFNQQENRLTGRKRRTNDDSSHDEQEIKKPKRVTRSRSTASNSNIVPVEIKQTKNNSSKTNLTSESIKAKPKTAIIRGRTKKQTIEPIPVPIQQNSPSHIYSTIERDVSVDRMSFATVAVSSSTQIAASTEAIPTTPKQSAFKRIQSLFRSSPTVTSSARSNRVLQTKSTVIAFGSSTPTNRMPTTITKTPATTAPSTPAASIVKKNPSPKGKYNLRTRLFHNNNPTYAEKDTTNDDDDKKSRIKKPSRTRK